MGAINRARGAGDSRYIAYCHFPIADFGQSTQRKIGNWQSTIDNDFCHPLRGLGIIVGRTLGFAALTPGFMLTPASRAKWCSNDGSTWNYRQPHERRMCSVMQNPLPDYDVACVPFIISAGIQVAVVFREGRGGDGDAQTMPGGNHS